jgi:hypothetical protein
MNKVAPTSCWTGMSPHISSGSQSLDIPDITSSHRDYRTRMDSSTPPPRSDLTFPRRNLRTRMDLNPLHRSPPPLSGETTTPSDQRQLRFAINPSAFLAQRIRKKVDVFRHRPLHSRYFQGTPKMPMNISECKARQPINQSS